MLVERGGGLIQLFKAKISPNYITFIYTKEMTIKYILHCKIIIIFYDFFQVMQLIIFISVWFILLNKSVVENKMVILST